VRDDYTVALYIRLSAEDENDGESNSVKNQRDLLTAFVKKNAELSGCKVIEFCDDGYSGVTFDRPNVKKMLERVRKGEIKCIVVKDFSRFGRNYIEVGDYLEQVFPFLGVRFISVNDHYDSDVDYNSIGGIEVALRALIYDLYSKDLSAKVKSALTAKKRRGESTSPYAIYGYIKSAKNKNRLEIDEEAAKIIRQIFELAISGKRAKEIAMILNTQNTLSRNEYKASKGDGRDWVRVSKIGTFWKDSDIRKIVYDKRYTGVAIGNYFERKGIGRSEYRLVPKEDWIVVPNAHAAIITDEEYEKAQKMLERVPRKKSTEKERFLFNKVRCHHCNHAMRRNRGKHPAFVCSTPISIYSPNCIQGGIPENVIENALLSAIQNQALLFAKTEKSRQKQHKALHNKLSDIQKSIRQFENTIQSLEAARQEHYEDYKDERITKDEFLFHREACNNQIEGLTANIAVLTEKLTNASSVAEQTTAINSEWQNSIGITELDRAIVDALVDSIIVYDSEHIEIRFKFADGYVGL